VAIVGRTGAGKSTIVLALFRMVEPEDGCQYLIGGHDAFKMGLHSLRQHISIIPDHPFIFEGTLRQNIDPFGTATDELLWQVLEDSNLSEIIQALPERL
jgi:ABC-type multidrug transport system fused ATPase/permease subunit